MNEQNLKPNTERTPSERVELARKAGRASGQKRRKNKEMREVVCAALELVDEETDQTNKERVAAALVDAAVHGNIKAVEMICKILGEFPERVELASQDGKGIQIEIIPSRRPPED